MKIDDTAYIISAEVIVMLQAIIQGAITCIIGWVIVERVIYYFREVKMAHQWRKQYRDEESRRQ